MDNYKLIFNDQEKNQWNWKNRQQQRKCTNKQNTCFKKWYRTDNHSIEEKYENLKKLYILLVHLERMSRGNFKIRNSEGSIL